MKNFFIILALLLTTSIVPAQDISTARSQNLGSTVTITGTVTNGPELGLIRYIEDSTAGIALYDLTTNNYLSNLSRGDSITISGELADYNGLLEIYVTGLPIVHSSNNPVPNPQIVSPLQVGELTESELIRIDNAVFSAGGSVFAVGTYDFISNSQQGKIYLRTNHPLLGEMIPVGPISIIGISSQYTFSVPANDGYQILPRDSNDIIVSSGLVITSPVVQSNITPTGFDLSWSTSDSSSTEANYSTTNLLGTLINTNVTSTNHTISFTGLQPATFYFVKCFSVKGADTAYSNIGYYSTASNSSGKILPYFNHSVDNSVSTVVDALNISTSFNDTIKAYIDRANLTLDICVYNASDQTIASAINDAYNRGVQIRYIADDDVVNSMLNSLNPNIQIVYRDPSLQGIMHNKFLIIDANTTLDSWVMSGSTNWTNPSNLFNDYNNLIFIQDQALAKAYQIEFEEMWSGNFGANKLDNTPHKFNVNGIIVESYFSPSDNTNSKINEVILSVDHTMEFALLSFTRDDLAQSAIDISNTFGVSARGIIEDENTTGGEYANLLSNGVNMRSHAGIPNSLHHKYLIADANFISSEPILLTGSHNWSNNAENNSDENTLIIYDHTIANIYLQEFTERYNELAPSEVSEKITITQLFPNPSSGVINIESSQKMLRIELYSMEGKLINITNHNRFKIKDKGIYFVKIYTDLGIVIKKVIVK